MVVMLLWNEGLSLLTMEKALVEATVRQIYRHTWPHCGALAIVLRSLGLGLDALAGILPPLLCPAVQNFLWLMTGSLVHLFMSLRLEHLTQACLCIPKPFGLKSLCTMRIT